MPVRYYAEWMDGEYVLLERLIAGYNHYAVIDRAIRLHALFGSTLVLSDVQSIDFRTPVPFLFRDRFFRRFLDQNPHFLALVAEPSRGARDQAFAVAMKGIERITDQANKPEDSFEMAVTQLGEPIFRAGAFDRDRYFDPKHRQKGQVAKVIKRFPRYKKQLTGLLYAVDYFSRCPLPTTTTPSARVPEGYDTLLNSVLRDGHLVTEPQAKRVEEIFRIQREHLPEEQRGRRAAIRKILGTGPWHDEDWKPENLRLYLDVVHAWNCSINRSIAPQAGTLYESSDDLPLSRYEQSVTDKMGWFHSGPMPSAGLTDRVRRFLAWDPIDSDWKEIAKIVSKTRTTAENLQKALQSQVITDRAEALKEHASHIADCLIGVPIKENHECVWSIAKVADAALEIVPPELLDVAEEMAQDGPYLVARAQKKLIVKTIRRAGEKLL